MVIQISYFLPLFTQLDIVKLVETAQTFQTSNYFSSQ